MLLPIEDALLLALLAGSMCALLLGDLKTYIGRRTNGALPLADASETPPLRSSKTPVQWGFDASARPIALPVAADLLVVDDSAVARAKLRRLFVSHGYSVHVACDGLEALDLVRKGRYSLMITDLEMPNMDGTTLIRECLRLPQTASLPIIAVSAHEDLRAKFDECRDICGVHRKPWVDDLLLGHVATQIGAGCHTGTQITPRLRTAA